MSLFDMSVAGGLLIAAIVLIRAMTRGRLPRAALLVLWAVVALRLLVPFSISSPFSVFNLLEGEQAATEPVFLAQIPLNITAGVLEQPPVANIPHGALSPLTLIYFAGLLVMLLFFVAMYVRHRRVFATSLPAEDDFVKGWLAKNPLRRQVQIRVLDKIDSPLTYGILRPVILLPKNIDWTDKAKLTHILTHEMTHIRRFDALTKLIMMGLLCLHWFNPLVWLMFFMLNRDIEISCDHAAIKRLGEGAKQSYSYTLITMATCKTLARKNFVPALYNNFGDNAVKERVKFIMKRKKTTAIGLIAATAIVVAATVVFATSGEGNGEGYEAYEPYIYGVYEDYEVYEPPYALEDELVFDVFLEDKLTFEPWELYDGLPPMYSISIDLSTGIASPPVRIFICCELDFDLVGAFAETGEAITLSLESCCTIELEDGTTKMGLSAQLQ